MSEYSWKPLSVSEVAELLKDLDCKWQFAGGFAIDLFLGKETRPHGDIDVLIQRNDQIVLQHCLSDWDLWVADPPGTLRFWNKNEFLEKGIQDIFIRKTSEDALRLQIML